LQDDFARNWPLTFNPSLTPPPFSDWTSAHFRTEPISGWREFSPSATDYRKIPCSEMPTGLWWDYPPDVNTRKSATNIKKMIVLVSIGSIMKYLFAV